VRTGYLTTVELRHALGTAWGGQWQAVAFVDAARLTVNKSAWILGMNSANLSGAGVGMNWAGPQQWRVKTYIATRLGSVPKLVASSASTIAWFELSRGF